MSAWTRLFSGSKKIRVDRAATTAVPEPKLKERLHGGRPSRILFVNQYYWPDHASTAQHLTDLAESLAEQGHECHVVCSKGGYQGEQASRPRSEVRNGVHIHRVGATRLGRRTTLRRMADYLSYYAQAAIRALAMPKFDLVVTLTTPPLIGLIGLLLRRMKGSMHVIWSMDLHPEAGVALGIMTRKNPVVAALAMLSDAVYRSADRVVVLGAYMADRIAAKKVRPNRIAVIPVWSPKDERAEGSNETNPAARDLGLDGKFVAMYSGNLGLAHSFDEFLEAARRLRDRDDIAFVFVGDGPRKKEVARAKNAEGLNNVHLMDYVPRASLMPSLRSASVHLVSMRREMTGIVVPGKLYGAMASGRPVIFVGPEHCETADTIREAGCGITLRLGDASGLVQSIEYLTTDNEAAVAMGERGREAFDREFERDVCCAHWSGMLRELVGEPEVVSVPEMVGAGTGRRMNVRIREAS